MGIFSRKVVVMVPGYIYDAIQDSNGFITLESIRIQMERSSNIVGSGYNGSNVGQHRNEAAHFRSLYKQVSDAQAKGREVVIRTQ